MESHPEEIQAKLATEHAVPSEEVQDHPKMGPRYGAPFAPGRDQGGPESEVHDESGPHGQEGGQIPAEQQELLPFSGQEIPGQDE